MAQETFKMKIQLLSETLIGAAEGFGAIIDKDSVFDEVGLPIVPGKRVKGILREQANLLKSNGYLHIQPEVLFGTAGLTNKSVEYLSVSNFLLPDYEMNKNYLKYLIHKNKISRSEVIEHFTSLRIMTSIEDGIAEDTSLRTFRVVKKGLIFTGELTFDPAHFIDFKNIVSLTRRIGSMRNRGLGHIKCMLIQKSNFQVEPVKSIAE